MKKQSLIIIAVLSMFLLSACSGAKPSSSQGSSSAQNNVSSTQTAQKSAYKQITAEEAKKMMDEGNVTVVDVRTQAEYEEVHIPGAVLVPVESIGAEAPEALPDKDAVLLVYCRSGNRSKTASAKLAELGYTNIYEFGGITNWPYETEAGEG